MYGSNQQLAMVQIGCILAPYFSNEDFRIPASLDDVVEAAEIMGVTIEKGDDLCAIRDKLLKASVIYIDIDTDPDPDCYDGYKWVIYNLYPPSDKPYALDFKNEDDERVEQLLCRLFGANRVTEGVVGVDRHYYYEAVHEICAENNIIINQVAPRLGDC